MKTIVIPTLDVNSERVHVAQVKHANETQVAVGDVLAEIETSKSVFELESPHPGFIKWALNEGDTASPGDVVAWVFDSLSELQAHRSQPPQEAKTTARASKAAEKRAQALGVDLGEIRVTGLITTQHVEAHAASNTEPSATRAPLDINDGRERVVVLGAGRGANQVIDIFAQAALQVAVAIVDDDPKHWGREIAGVPVIGGCEQLQRLHQQGLVDKAIVSVSKTTRARKILREKCEVAGLKLTNAIDPTSKIATEVTMGVGNVICAFCQVGTCSVVGDNNFLSAYNSIEHHNTWGSDISTGPGCMTSSRVVLKDRVRLGTGIFIQPGVELGEEAAVASGSILVDSVPARHTVKTKIVTTIVVPPTS